MLAAPTKSKYLIVVLQVYHCLGQVRGDLSVDI